MNRIASIAFISALCACSGDKSKTLGAERTSSAEGLPRSAAGCDARLWNHVYSPKRLEQVSPCLSVTGVIDESDVDNDGDQHFLLKLDPGQDSLVNKRNAKKKSGDLVLE